MTTDLPFSDPLSDLPFSIIVPVLNEAATLPELLRHLQHITVPCGGEVVLVDGGSTDTSLELMHESGYTVVRSAAGRARQMNAGAAAAAGEVLFFLHADTRLPTVDLRELCEALAQTERQWGRFDVRIHGRSRLLPVVALLMNVRSRLTGIATGDQCLFIQREVFFALGGFPNQPIMEDIAMCVRLNNVSRPLCVRSRVATSGRRWDTNGAWRTIFLMWRLRWLYWRGQCPTTLATMYR